MERDKLSWGFLLLLSIALHLWGLDGRTFHHDEAVHGTLTFNLAFTGEYRYAPAFHGPFLYFFGSAVFWLLGDSDFTARLITSVFGIGMLWVAWALRRPFGARTAWWAGLLVTISPLYLYYGRFFRHDMVEIFTASAAFLCLYAALKKSKEFKHWIWTGIWASLAFSTKENAFVTLFLFVSTLLLVALTFGFRQQLKQAWRTLIAQWRGLVVATGWFVIVTISLYTAFFRYPEDWVFPVKAIRYWAEQHDIERLAGPWWYHLFRLFQYEYLILGAALVWVFRRTKLRPIEIGLFTFGIASIVMYAYLGEKVAWLGLHQVWSFIPLAAAQLARTFGPSGKWWSRTVAVVAIALTMYTAFAANFLLAEITLGQRKVESLHYFQTSPELKMVAGQIQHLGEAGQNPAALIVGQLSSPLRWYLRHSPVYWGINGKIPMAPIIVMDAEQEQAVCEMLDCADPRYRRFLTPAQYWWQPESEKPSLGQYLQYLFTRKIWARVEGLNLVVLRREEEILE